MSRPAAELAPVPAEAAPTELPARRSRTPILAAVAAALLIGGAVVWTLEHGRESTDDAQIDADVVAVPTHIGGTVRAVLFQENQRVAAGALLAELDDSQLKARLAQAEATLAQASAQADAADADAALGERNAVGNRSAARASLAGAAVGEKTSSEQLAEGQAQLSAAEASFTQADQDLGRARTLAASGAMSRAQLDQAETQRRLADSNLRLARARMDTLRSSVSAARSRVEEASARAAQSSDVSTSVRLARARAAAAHAQVEVARAQRDLAALDLSYTHIIAPQAGVLSKKAINVGQQISTGQPIVQLVTDERWLTANFKETQVGHMRVGQPAKIEVDAFSGRALRGQVESLAGGTGARFTLLPPDNATGNFTKVVQRVPVRIRLVDPPAELPLRPGMSAEITVDTR
jgi:membrane fusion protein (multidrug efflux system)